MATIALTAQASRARLVGFSVVSLATAALFGLLFEGLPALVTGWGGRADGVHLVHDVTHGVADGLLVALPCLVQLWPSWRQIALTQQVVLVVAVDLILIVASGAALPLPLLAVMVLLTALLVVLHPERERLLARAAGTSAPLLVVAASFGLGAIIYAAGQFNLQVISSPADTHAMEFHYVGMAAGAVALAVVALLASLRTPGWQYSAASAGVGALIVGSASALFPDRSSTLGVFWGAALVLGGLAFIALAYTQRLGADQ